MAGFILKAVAMPVSRIVLYGISIGGMMLGPFLLARYLAYRWQLRMTPFYWGLLVPVLADAFTGAGVIVAQRLFPSFLPRGSLVDPNIPTALIIAPISLIWSLFYTIAVWWLLRTVFRKSLTPHKTVLFSLGAVALWAFFSGFFLATFLVRVAVADRTEQAQTALWSPEDRQAWTEGIEEQRRYLFEGPFYVPFSPLLKVSAYAPWLIFFSLLVFWGVIRSRPHYVAFAFIFQFALGFATGWVSGSGPPHSSHKLLFETVMLALSVLPVTLSRVIFRLAQQSEESYSEMVNRSA